tara:strand:+ start:861 stop:1019 length:159 start_codon:yes stop_codon:yes gene_type:complete
MEVGIKHSKHYYYFDRKKSIEQINQRDFGDEHVEKETILKTLKPKKREKKLK